ncbi:MAG: hypothetical protein R2748_16545 [Bryobacterales bacterium]
MSQRVLLLGLEEETASQLADVVSADKFEIVTIPGAAAAQYLDKLDSIRPSVICVPAGAAATPLVHAIRSRLALARIVRVSSHPNQEEWHATMQEGASDYFGAPFLKGQVDWVLDGATAGHS